MVSRSRACRLARAVVVLGAVASLVLPAVANGAERRRDVAVGSFDPNSLSSLNAFYPSTTTLHVGDSILFKINGFHNATFVPPGDPVPTFLQQLDTPYPAENDFAGDPWWWGNKVGEYQGVADVIFPSASNVVDGSTLVSSGLISSKFEVTFPQEGTFTFFCSIHPDMKESVTVLPAGAPGTQTQQKERARAEQAEDAAASEAAFAEWQAIPDTSRTVLVGPGARDFSSPQFFPSHPTLPVGEDLTFVFPDGVGGDPHTVTFGPIDVLGGLARQVFPDLGGDLVFAPVSTLPSEPPKKRDPFLLSTTTHGIGFANSGLVSYPGINREVLGPTPPAGRRTSFTFRFTQPGTYHFECLVHFGFMSGDVTVTPAT